MENLIEGKTSISEIRFFILNSEGKEELLSLDNIGVQQNQFDSTLNTLIMATIGGVSESVHFAHHMDIIQQLGWADYEPASDKGHFRYYPNGALVYQLLSSWCEWIAEEKLEALSIKTPFLYHLNSQIVKEQIGMFSKNIYICSTEQKHEELVLRFNDDLGLLAMMKDARLTYEHMPIRIYEQTPSFRYIQSGAIAGINKGRYFSLNDVHSFCTDLQQGFQEYVEIQKILEEIAKAIGINLAIHFKVTQDFYPIAKKAMISMLKNGEKMLVELLPKQKQYWTMKHIVCTDHPQRLFHVQLDLENSERFGIKYVNKNGSLKNCVIIHTSLGTVERWMIITIEDALKKNPPTLPLWLSPTQVRIIPVSEEKHISFCINLAQELKQCKIRVDVDDRKEKVGWRIRAAEREWIPYIIVCGDKEQTGASLPVRIRGKNQIQMSLSELVQLINRQTFGMPFRSLPGVLVSKRPIFKGRD